MAIPKQVEENAQLAEDFMASLKADVEETNDQEQVEEEEVVEEDESEEEHVEPEAKDSEQTWEQRYKTLQGMFDSQVPKLSNELKELKQSIIDKLGSKDKAVEQEVVTPEDAALQERIAKFRNEYTPEYVDDLVAVLRHELSADLQKTVQPLQERVNGFEEVQTQTAQKEFKAYLTANVNGDWEKLWSGQDEGFKEFLAQPDPTGLMTMGDLAESFNNQWDAGKLATLMNLYVGEKAPEVVKQVSPDKKALVAPTRSHTSATPVVEDKILWTPASIKQFQADERLGKISGDKAAAMWQDLLSAPNEGRINDI